MRVVFVNRSCKRMPKKIISKSVSLFARQLKKRKIGGKSFLKKIVIVFVDKNEIKKINYKFRDKNSFTDILSFTSIEEGFLGELVICPQVIVDQAKQNGWTQKKEFSYMILHGILHLIGYDHKTPGESKKMLELQDNIFEEIKI